MIKIDVDYSAWKDQVLTKGIKHFNFKQGINTLLFAIDGPMCFSSIIRGADIDDYKLNFESTANQKIGDELTITPFAQAGNFNFRGIGKKFIAQPVSTSIFELPITQDVANFNGVAIIGGTIGDTISLKIRDTETGTYTNISNKILNQFGFDWNITPPLTREILKYESKLLSGMKIVIEYTSKSTESKYIGVNYYVHEVKLD